MTISYSTDILIAGGGIGGLWLLNRLGRQGYDCIVVDKHGLGSGQSLASQGIIHGGLKYALSGVLSPAAQAAADMPRRWRECFSGEGEIDLSGCGVLSDHYYLWSDGGIRSKLKTFLGSRSLRGRVTALGREAYPPEMRQASTDGSLYELQDFVIDTGSVLKKLAANYPHKVLACGELVGVDRNGDGKVTAISLSHNKNVINITVRAVVLCAGEGNRGLLGQFGIDSIGTQLRPLKMVYLKQRNLPSLFLHCIGGDFGLTPELTVTSHRDAQGCTLWYLGGELAESGVKRDDDAQIEVTRQLLKRFLPWVDVSGAEFHCLTINRAEADPGNNHRPDDACLAAAANVIAAWPTKLTLCPSLADKLIEYLRKHGPTPPPTREPVETPALPPAITGRAPWDLQ